MAVAGLGGGGQEAVELDGALLDHDGGGRRANRGWGRCARGLGSRGLTGEEGGVGWEATGRAGRPRRTATASQIGRASCRERVYVLV